MKTCTTTKSQLEHRSVQGGIEPLTLKARQALNLLMKLNLISCVLPDFGSLMIYFITTVIDNLNFFLLIGWLVNREKDKVRLQG